MDAREIFDHLPRDARLELFYDELHLTPEGNRLLATQVGEAISSMFPLRVAHLTVE